MFLNRTKTWWKCAIARAERTVAQTILSLLPVGVVITPSMIKETNFDFVFVILAWVLTGLFGGLTSLLTSYVKGLPESEVGYDDNER